MPAAASGRQCRGEGRVLEHHPEDLDALCRVLQPHRGEPPAAVILAHPPGDRELRTAAAHHLRE